MVLDLASVTTTGFDLGSATSFFQSPGIPQLHESTLGLHIKSTNLDQESNTATLVCSQTEKDGVTAGAVHPEITFNEPMQDLHVLAAGGPKGKIVWDAFFNLNGKTVLTKQAVPTTGMVPQWNKICTPPGEMEQYNMFITGTSTKSGPIQTSISFTSDNGLGVELPAKTLMVRVPLPGGNPLAPVIVPIRPQTDLNPLNYLQQRLF